MSGLALLEDGAIFPDGSLVAVRQIGRNDGRQVSQLMGQMSEFSTDRWQGMGVGTLLARHLAGRARSTGIRYWEALMLSENRRRERLLARVGTEVATPVESRLVTSVRDISLC